MTRVLVVDDNHSFQMENNPDWLVYYARTSQQGIGYLKKLHIDFLYFSLDAPVELILPITGFIVENAENCLYYASIIYGYSEKMDGGAAILRSLDKTAYSVRRVHIPELVA